MIKRRCENCNEQMTQTDIKENFGDGERVKLICKNKSCYLHSVKYVLENKIK